MSVTYAKFIEAYDEFAPPNFTQGKVSAVLSDCHEDVNADSWGVKRNRGIMLLTAHVLTMRRRGETDGSPAPLLEETIGKHRRSFANMGGWLGQSLTATVYGTEFMRLQDSLGLSPVVV
jgi:hypothetical protein